MKTATGANRRWKRTLWIGLMLLAFTADIAVCAAADQGPIAERRISIAARDRELSLLLKDIAERSGIEVFVVDPIIGERRSGDWVDQPIASVLRTLLRGRSYAIVSGEGGPFQGRVNQFDADAPSPARPAQRAVPDRAQALPALSVANDRAAELPADKRKRRLQRQIDSLQQQIDEGLADQRHAQWTARKDPKYVRHPADTLAQLKRRLATME